MMIRPQPPVIWENCSTAATLMPPTDRFSARQPKASTSGVPYFRTRYATPAGRVIVLTSSRARAHARAFASFASSEGVNRAVVSARSGCRESGACGCRGADEHARSVMPSRARSRLVDAKPVILRPDASLHSTARARPRPLTKQDKRAEYHRTFIIALLRKNRSAS